MNKDSLLLTFRKNELMYLITEAINNNYQIFAIDNHGKHYLLNAVHLRDISSHHPHKAQIYFQRGQTPFDSEWANIGFDGLYGDKNQGRAILKSADILEFEDSPRIDKKIDVDKSAPKKRKLPQHTAREENNKDKFIALLLHDYHKSKQVILDRGISALSTCYEQLANTINIKLSDSTIETFIKTAINHLPGEKKT